MAKKNHSHAPETKKKPGAGAVFGSVILFIVTLLLSVLLMLSTSLHLMLKNHAPSHALSEIALSQIQIDGQSFGSWFYTCYLWNAEGLNPAYGESVVAHPEFRAFFQNHLSDIEHYYLKETDDIPELSADALFDLMQNGNGIADDLKQQTGITLNDTHREAFLYNAEEDVADWNAAIAGNSFTRGMLRFLCSLPGVITVGVLTGVIFLLWLFLAIASYSGQLASKFNRLAQGSYADRKRLCHRHSQSAGAAGLRCDAASGLCFGLHPASFLCQNSTACSDTTFPLGQRYRGTVRYDLGFYRYLRQQHCQIQTAQPDSGSAD